MRGPLGILHACRGIWVPHPLRFSAWGHQAAWRFALLPSSPGVPFALVSAVCLLLQVYNQFTYVQVGYRRMIYRLHELLRFLGLKDGLFEQPGDSSSDGTVGAVSD